MSVGETLGRDGRLLRVLGVSFGVAVTIGGMIGLGILRTPGTIAAQLGDAWLIMLVWAAGAVYALFGTFAAAELGTSVPVSGGWYAFARRAFGDYGGFLAGWMDWSSYPPGLALQVVTAAEYAAILFPGLPVKTTAAALAIGMALVNWVGVNAGARVQEVTSFGKALVFLLLIGCCFIFGGTDGSAPRGEAGLAIPSGFAFLTAFIIALQGVIYTYDGWFAAIYFNEESKDLGRTLPRAMIGGVLGVAAIYLLFNAALLYVMPIERMAGSELAAAEAADAVFGANGKTLITLLAIVSLLSITNSNIMSGPRILFAMARDGLFPKRATEVNAGGTPTAALALTVGLALPLIAFGTFETLLAISAFMFILNYLLAFFSLIVLRRKEPGLERPYKAWGYPWTTLVVVIGSIAFLAGAVAGDTINAIYAIGAVAISYPLYRIARAWCRYETRAASGGNP